MALQQDNLDPQVDNQDPQVTPESVTPDTATPETPFSWKTNLPNDLRDSPTMQKFDDNVEGLNKAVNSHLSLEKMLGHDKVVLPKGEDDSIGWATFNKAIGVPEKADGYTLGDAKMPPALEGQGLSKSQFAEVMHKNGISGKQASGLWKDYIDNNTSAYNKTMQEYGAKVDSAGNQLRGEWGDAYNSNVELGQLVIKKFSDDEESVNFITQAMASDPRGIKFLQRVGQEFSENKIGDFQIRQFTMTPAEAQRELDRISGDMTHPYRNPKASEDEHTKAVDYVNGLQAILSKKRT